VNVLVRSIAVAGVFVAMSGPVFAQQPTASDCSKWIARINDEAGMRLDDASYDAKVKAERIAQLCKDGKTAEAEKMAKEVMASLGLK
jgi:hypothetical protein